MWIMLRYLWFVYLIFLKDRFSAVFLFATKYFEIFYISFPECGFYRGKLAIEKKAE